MTIYENDTMESLSYRKTKISIINLYKVLNRIFIYKRFAYNQMGNSSYANNKLDKWKQLIDWKCSAKSIVKRIRALHPKPYAYIRFINITAKITNPIIIKNIEHHSYIPGEIINVTKKGIDIQSRTDIIRLLQIQISGKKMLLISQIINGYNLKKYIGKVL
jgi:methionyl-tRNA formyltransferase